RGGAERPRRMAMKRGSTMAPDVGRVIGANNGLNPSSGEDVTLDEAFQIGDRSQHDVDDVLLDDRLDRIEELGARLKMRLARRSPSRMQTRSHVGVLGVGDNEIRTPIGAAANACELVVEPEHERLSSLAAGLQGAPYGWQPA